MTKITSLVTTLSLSLFLAACGGDDSTPAPDGPPAGGPDGGAPDGGAPANWTALVTADWSLGAGQEITSDVRTMDITRDIYVGGIRPIDPVGTHHTVLAVDNLDIESIIYASGVGTNEIMFPEGVGLRLTSGQTLFLQLHLFNTDDAPISGTSGIEIVEVDPADVTMEADLFLPGPFTFSIPPMQTYSYAGTCTVQGTYSFFAIFPHMHQMGAHLKTTFNAGGSDVVVHDGAYDFNDQAFIPFAPVTLNAGDTITTECTWTNPTASAVLWGESSTTEMCFSILYRYPAGNESFCMN